MGSLKTVSLMSYALHTVVALAAIIPGVQVSVLLLVVAFILDLAKRGDARGTWLESHFDYRLRTVVIAGLLYAFTAPLWFLLVIPGWVAWGLISLWFAYRIVTGFLRLGDGQPV
jgi:uncharacterized membrane protein